MSLVKFIAGLYYMVVFRLDDDGVAFGQATDPDSPTVDTNYPSYLVTHPVSVASGGATFTTATDRGGQAWRGNVNLGLENPGTITITLSDYDQTFDAIVSGNTPDTSYNTGWTRGGRDDLKPIPPRVGVIVFSGASSRDSADYGALSYQAWYRVGTIRGQDPEQNQNGGENPSALTYTMELQTIDAEPTGLPLANITGLAYTDDKAVTYPMQAPGGKMFHIETWVADGTETTFTLEYLPSFNDATATGRNILVKNGVHTAVTSVNIANGLVTLSAAGTSGDVWTVLYPTAWVAS